MSIVPSLGVIAAAAILASESSIASGREPPAKPISSAPHATPSALSNPKRQSSPVRFPHPLITEVLFAVPTGDEGDADQDGARNATGDEFVELINPHDKPIQLKGYAITDATPADPFDKNTPNRATPTSKPAPQSAPRTARPSEPKRDGQKPASTPAPDPDQPDADTDDPPDAGAKKTSLRFVFPDLELQPGEVVVVFNGHNQRIAEPCGTTSTRPRAHHPAFHDAWVFTMNVRSQYVAFGNRGDCVMLRDPAGNPIEAITWGKPKLAPPTGTPLVEKAPECKGSVQRVGLTTTLAAHDEMKWREGQRSRERFSPGEFDPDATPAPLHDDPAPTPKPKKKSDSPPPDPTPAPPEEARKPAKRPEGPPR